MSPGPVKLIRACPPWVLRLALFLVVAIGVYLRIQRLDDNPSRSPDERMYVELASRLAHDGPFATQALFRNFVANPILWDYPSPNRSGFLLPLAAAMRLAGRYDFSVAAAVSVMASILTLLLAVGLAIRHFGLTAALGTAVVMCSSVVELGLASRAWQDSLFCLLNLLLFGLAAEIIRQPRRNALYIAYHAAGAWCLLTKPSAPVLYALCSVGLAVLLIRREGSLRRAMAILVGGPVAILTAFAVWSVLGGGTGLALQVLIHSLQPGPGAWEYSRLCCSGPAWQLSWVMVLISPLAALLATVGLRDVWRNKGSIGWIAAFVLLGFLAFLSLYRDLQSVRYLSPVHGIYCLLVGIGLTAVGKWAAISLPRESRLALFVLLGAIAPVVIARDYRVFESIKATGAQDFGAVQVREILSR